MFWRGKPIYISHRTKTEIEAAQKMDMTRLGRAAYRTHERVKKDHDQWLS